MKVFVNIYGRLGGKLSTFYIYENTGQSDLYLLVKVFSGHGSLARTKGFYFPKEHKLAHKPLWFTEALVRDMYKET